MIPSCDQTGTFHFHSSTTSGSASLIKARRRASILPRQSPSSLILPSIIWDAVLSPWGALFIMRVVFPLRSEVDEERRREQRRADADEPEEVLGEVRIDAQQHAREHGRELPLLLAVHEIADAECPGDH